MLGILLAIAKIPLKFDRFVPNNHVYTIRYGGEDCQDVFEIKTKQRSEKEGETVSQFLCYYLQMTKKTSFHFVFLFLTFALLINPPVFAADTSRVNPIIWKTEYAKLAASNFHIRIGDKFFYGVEPISIQSDPGPAMTTLELSWKENGVDMRMNMYFKMKPDGEWEMYDLRAYNGQSRGDWLYFNVTDSLNNDVSSLPGMQNFVDQQTFLSKNSTDAEIYCDDCSIVAFLNKPLSYSAQGYALEVMNGLQANETIALLPSQDIGYGVNVLLRNQNREVVIDQKNMTYEWLVQNPSVAKVYPRDIKYAEGGCAYGIQEPCPLINGQIAGINSGVTTIIVNVRQNGNIIASNEFDVKVAEKTSYPNTTNSPTPTVSAASPSPLPSKMPDSNQENQQLRQEVEALKGTVGQIKLDVSRQQQELTGLQKIIQSLRDMILRLFRS